MVVGKVPFEEIISLLSLAEDKLKREVNPVVYPVNEFKKKIAVDHHFIKTVLENRKIFLVGDEDELTKLVGKRADQSPSDK